MRDHGRVGGAVRVRRRRHRDAEHGPGGAAAAGVPGRAVARVLGLTESYVSTLFSAARRDESAALVSQPRRGRPGTVSGRQCELAREWRAGGVSDAEIGRRLGVAHTTIGRGLGQRDQAARQQAPAPLQAEPLFSDPGAAPEADAEPDAAQADPGTAWPVIGEGVFASRHAGAMLLHAFFARADAARRWPAAPAGRARRWRCCRRSACASR